MTKKMVLIASLASLFVVGCAPRLYELHSITPILISKKDPSLKIFKKKVCKKVVEEEERVEPAAGQPDSAKPGAVEPKARKFITRCKTTPDHDYGSWFLRRVYAKRQGKRMISTVEILWCDTGKHNYEKCRVAVAWSRNPTGGLGEEKGTDIKQHVVPEAEAFRQVKWPDQHGVPGHGTKRRSAKAKKKPVKDTQQKKRLQETPVADEL